MQNEITILQKIDILILFYESFSIKVKLKNMPNKNTLKMKNHELKKQLIS